MIIDFLETFTILSGGYDGKWLTGHTSSGFAINLRGIFKLLDKGAPNKLYKFMKERLDVKFISSTYKETFEERNYKGLVISINSF